MLRKTCLFVTTTVKTKKNQQQQLSSPGGGGSSRGFAPWTVTFTTSGWLLETLKKKMKKVDDDFNNRCVCQPADNGGSSSTKKKRRNLKKKPAGEKPKNWLSFSADFLRWLIGCLCLFGGFCLFLSSCYATTTTNYFLFTVVVWFGCWLMNSERESGRNEDESKKKNSRTWVICGCCCRVFM